MVGSSSHAAVTLPLATRLLLFGERELEEYHTSSLAVGSSCNEDRPQQYFLTDPQTSQKGLEFCRIINRILEAKQIIPFSAPSAGIKRFLFLFIYLFFLSPQLLYCPLSFLG